MSAMLRRFSFGLLLLASAARAQSLPADTGVTAPGVGFSLPRVGGSLNYGVSASELVSTGYYNNQGTGYSTGITGDVAYISKSQAHPFSAVYDGGVLIGNSDQPTTVFQGLSLSQVLATKHWNFTVTDSVAYLPQSPVGGLSGVPGTGDLGVAPISVGTTIGEGILTTYGPRVSNSLSGTAARQITGHVSAQATGVFALQRFIGDNASTALDSTTEGGSLGVSYRFSARDTLTGNYNYSRFSYPGDTLSFSAQGATIEYARQWSRRFTTDVYAGPQIVSGSGAFINGTSVNVAAGATASYLSRSTTYSIAYARGANNGSGVVPGSFSDSISAGARRQFGRDWSLAGTVGFSRTTTLPNFTLYAFNGKNVFLSGQGSRSLGRSFSAYLSYTLEDQSTNTPSGSAIAPNAFNGLYQVVSIGISYFPHSILLGK